MLGDKIRTMLRKRELSQKDAAALLEIDVARLNSYINNKAVPNYLMLIKIADFFNISVDELIDHPCPSPHLTEQEQELLTVFKELDRRGRYKTLCAAYEELEHIKLREKEQAEEKAKSLVSAG